MRAGVDRLRDLLFPNAKRCEDARNCADEQRDIPLRIIRGVPAVVGRRLKTVTLRGHVSFHKEILHRFTRAW